MTLEKLEAATTDLRLPPEEETADYLGRLDHVMRKLREHKAAILSELSGPIGGEDYRVVESRYAERSYNTAGLLSTFASRNVSIHDLLRSGVVKMSWQWSKLTRALADSQLGLQTVPHEIEDFGEVDGPLVGEVWRTRMSVEAVKE